MSIFWDHLYTLLIFLIAGSLGIGVFRSIRANLRSLANSAQPEKSDEGPLVRHHGAPEPVPEEPEEPVKGQHKLFQKRPARERKPGQIRAALRGAGAMIAGMMRELKKREVIKWIVMDMVIAMMISVLLAMFATSSIGGLDIYMSTYLPMMGVLLVLFAFTESIHGSRVIAMITSVLILTGVALQGLLRLSETEPSASDLVVFAVLSMALAVAACFVLRMITSSFNRKPMVVLLNIALIGVYAVLAVFGKNIYGTKAWLIIGGFSFQLTEITKVISLLIFGLVFTDASVENPNRRMFSALVTLCINGVMLLAVNELGTLCILGLVFFIMGFMYLPDIRGLLGLAGILLVCVALILFVCFHCYNIVYPEPDPTETTAVTKTAAEATEAVEATEAAATEAAGEQAEEEKSPTEKVVELGAKVWRKFKLRYDLMVHPETVDPLGGGYQLDKAMDALSLSSYLGSVFEVDIPVVESDYIYTFLVLKMGVIYAVLVLIMMLLMLASGIQSCLANPMSAEASVGVAFTLGIVMQSLIAAASATGSFITIGLPFSFLSAGGTAAVTNYMMAVFIIYVTGRVQPAKPRPVGRFARKERV